MKFRGKISDPNHIRQFAQLIHILAKCSKDLSIAIEEHGLVFIVLERYARCKNYGANVFCTVPNRPYFSEFAMEGVSPEANEIHLEIPTDSFAGVLSNLRTSQEVISLKIKLTKKQIPCLTLEVEVVSSMGTQNITHDIPVTVINKRQWDEYNVPELPQFDVTLEMPDLKIVQRSFDRMRNLAPKMKIAATKAGQLSFAIETYPVTSTVTFKDRLRIVDYVDDENDGETYDGDNEEGKAHVAVDMRALMQTVPQEVTKPTKYFFSILKERQLHIHYVYGEINLHYLLPGTDA